jgi:hypothetical protein
MHIDTEDGGSMYLRNVEDIAHMHKVWQYKNGINIDN